MNMNYFALKVNYFKYSWQDSTMELASWHEEGRKEFRIHWFQFNERILSWFHMINRGGKGSIKVFRFDLET